ncbi:uncharacterized protein LOC105842656 isoform X1 [Bombyx mori]|uniref:Uncharacterized protein n=1 Tax=Bombyx mori TaxID=7091 RepID=A0A8R2GAF8_BOMMO|nr:uncharacterized protein LOC105842388 [Bombyx mori]
MYSYSVCGGHLVVYLHHLNMHYILLTELETVGYTSCKIQGLNANELELLKTNLIRHDIKFLQNQNFHEIEALGVRMLNLLAENDFNYRVLTQSMVIEESKIGGRNVQLQKIVWTMYKE